nr:NAD(P)/FAD-dependent oxidoreductase [Polaromonas sp. OV174]
MDGRGIVFRSGRPRLRLAAPSGSESANPSCARSELHARRPRASCKARHVQGRTRASQAELDALDKAYQALERRLANVGPGDSSMASLLTDPSDWAAHMAVRTVAELDTGGAAENTSALGVFEQGSTSPNWLVQEGMGRIVESLSPRIGLALNSRVSEIEQLSGGVKLLTSGGDIRAQHCIVTVSTGVLRAEAIRFKPGLENAALAALDALPMGHFNKVVMEFDGPLQGFAPGDWLSAGKQFQPEKALAFLVNPFGSHLVIALAGGAYGQQLSSLPARDAENEVMSQLKDCLGTLGGRKLTASLRTDWSANALFNGGYAYLRTGGGDARKTLASAGTDRIHFAGEATAVDLAQTCGGAYLTGIRTAERIDTMLRNA